MKYLFSSHRMIQILATWIGACWGWDLIHISFQALEISQELGFIAQSFVPLLCAGAFWKLLEQTPTIVVASTSNQYRWFLPLLGFYLFKLPFPDMMFDTLHYHLFLQNPTSWKLLQESFFPGAMGTYLWPLADRLFFLPREFLGYRLGTLLNLMVAWICFIQILDWLGHHRPWAGFFAFASLSTEAILVEFGSYYVDLLPLPFLMVLVRESLAPNQPGSCRRAITCGALSIALKMASLPMVIVASVLWVIQAHRVVRKILAPSLIVAVFLMLIFPYLLTAAKHTGNPLFPVLNSLFPSPLFPAILFRDERWGPKSFIEFILFPVLAIFKKTRLYEGAIYGGRLAFYGLPVWILIQGSRFHRDSNQRLLSIVILVMMALWELSTGYIRYALFLEVFIVVLIAEIFFDFFESHSLVKKKTALLLATALVLQCGFSWMIALKRTVRDLGFQTSITHLPGDYFKNLIWIGRDQSWNLDPAIKQQLASIDGLISHENTAGLWSLLKPETPFIRFNVGWSTPALEALKQERIKALLKKGLFTYTLESSEKVPFKDSIQNLRIHLEDQGWMGPIPFLPVNISKMHLFRVQSIEP